MNLKAYINKSFIETEKKVETLLSVDADIVVQAPAITLRDIICDVLATFYKLRVVEARPLSVGGSVSVKDTHTFSALCFDLKERMNNV